MADEKKEPEVDEEPAAAPEPEDEDDLDPSIPFPQGDDRQTDPPPD